MFFLGIILGIFIGMLLVVCISVNAINENQLLVVETKQTLRRKENEIKDLNKENKELYEENKKLRFENEELTDIINNIYSLATSNTYNNNKAILAKIKEVITDGQINK